MQPRGALKWRVSLGPVITALWRLALQLVRLDDGEHAMAGLPPATRTGTQVKWRVQGMGALALGASMGAAVPAQAGITYVGSNTAGAAGPTNSILVFKPSGVITGDVMLTLITQRGNNFPLDQGMASTPVGWTLVVSKDNGSSVGISLYKKVAAAVEPALYTWTLGASDRTAAGIVAFRGVDASSPVNVSGAQQNSASTTYIAPSVTTTTANAMLVSFYGADNGNGSINASVGMTQAFSAGTGAGPNGVVVGSSYATQAAAGTSGTQISASNPSLVNIGALVALKPGATGGGPDHYELSLPSASINCLPTTVSVTACSNTSSPCTSAYSAAAGSTATLATSGATLAVTSVTFNASGVASTTLSYPSAANSTPVSVTLSGEQAGAVHARQCCPNGSNCAAANSCSTTFSSAGLVVAASAGGAPTSLPTQTSGTVSSTYFLRAVQSSTTSAACTPALTGATSVGWAYQCNNPATCSVSNLMSINSGTATPILGNNNASALNYTSVPMTFDASGNAPFTLTFGDVGQATVWVTKTVNGATLNGASNPFVTKPAGYVVSSIVQTASPYRANPAASGVTGPKFIKAGETFSATVTAQTSTGTPTPNYGKETFPEGVLLSQALVLPSGGATGTLSNATVTGGSFNGGAASVTNLAWDEVGILTLTPSVADGDYLGAGDVIGTTTGNVGRFIPDHFSITQGTLVAGCSSAFTYFGQDGLTTTFALKAVNVSNASTQNYTGGFALLGLTSWSNFGFAAVGLPPGSALGASAMAPFGTWSAGVANVWARHQVSRPAAPMRETSVVVTAAPVDSDGVTAAVTQLGLATPLRYGRLRLSNAFGPEKMALQMSVQAEYWSGNSWVPNSADSCTVVPAAAVARSAYLDNKGATTTAWTTTPSAINVVGGNGTLTLSAPTPMTTGSVDLALNLGSTPTDQACLASHPGSTGAALPWLRAQHGSCSTAWDRDPSARASFGIYAPETRKMLHIREIF